MGINATTDFEKSQSKYAALVAECAAEAANVAAFDAQRQHDFELKKATAFNDLGGGKNTKIVMSGSSGEALINKIFSME